MDDVKIDANLESAEKALEQLKLGNDKVNLAKSNMATNPFKSICSNPDLATHYITEYFESLEEMYKFSVDNIYAALESYIAGLKKQPGEITEPIGGVPGGPGGGGSGGGGSGGSGSGNPPTGTEDPPEELPDVPPIDSGEQINTLDTESLNDLSLNDLDGVVDTLKNLADKNNKGIDEILADDTLADELKAILLASNYIPDELKEQLKDVDSQIVRQLFESIMRGERPEIFDVNPLNLGIVYRYLTAIAEANGITLEELLSNPKYTELLKETLGEFEYVIELLKDWDNLPPEEYQKNLLKIYDGDGIGDINKCAVDVVREFTEYISEATDIYGEELLTDEKYAEVLKTAAQELGKTSLLIEATSHYSANGMGSVIGDLFNGKNAKALGMDDNEVKGFREEMEALAKENGVEVTELLSNKNYADVVKEALANSKNAAEVGTIYSQADATVSQNVAKNLVEGSLKVESETINLEDGTTVMTKETV